jgi:hypothetical protein
MTTYKHTDRHTNKHTNKHKHKTNTKEGGPSRPVYEKSLLTRFKKGSCVDLCRSPVGGWPPRSHLVAQGALPLGFRGLRAEYFAGCGVGCDYPTLSLLCGVSAQGVEKGASRDTGLEFVVGG